MTVVDTSEVAEERYRQMFAQHFSAVYRYVLSRSMDRSEVDDAVADVFAVAWRRLAELPAPMDARPYLVGIARNVL